MWNMQHAVAMQRFRVLDWEAGEDRCGRGGIPGPGCVRRPSPPRGKRLLARDSESSSQLEMELGKSLAPRDPPLLFRAAEQPPVGHHLEQIQLLHSPQTRCAILGCCRTSFLLHQDRSTDRARQRCPVPEAVHPRDSGSRLPLLTAAWRLIRAAGGAAAVDGKAEAPGDSGTCSDRIQRMSPFLFPTP